MANATTLNGSWQQRIANDLTEAKYNNSAFGETSIAENRPFIQATAVYNFLPSNFRAFTSGSGSTSVANQLFNVETGTSVGGYGTIQTFRSLNYKAGEGGLARFTAIFENNVANSWQGVGLLTIADEYSFGYNGTDFGIWHRYNGLAEVRTITVSSGAGGSENLTLTLNGVAYTIPLTSGTAAHNASEIEQWLLDNQSVWGADQIGDTIIINALSDGAKSGSYSFSSSTAAGSMAQNTAGQTKTSNHIPRTEWNVNTFDNLDPTKGNVYQIKYQYLGFGNIFFYVEDPLDGVFKLCHQIIYANENTTPSVSNPSLKFGMYCVSLGSTTNLKVSSASVACFVQGLEGKTRNPRAVINTQSIAVNETLTNVLTLRNRRTYNYITNQVEIEPINVTIANEAAKNIKIEVRGNATVTGNSNYELAGNNLVGDVDYTSHTLSGGRLLAAFAVSPGDSIDINLADKRIRIPPTLKLSIGARKESGAAADVTATLTYYEDV